MTLKVISLWSLMKQCRVWELSKLLGHLGDSLASLKHWAESEGRDDILTNEARDLYVDGIITIAQVLAIELKLESTNDRVWSGGGALYLKSNSLTWQQAYSELKFLREAIEADLEKHFFVQLTPSRKNLLDETKDNWEGVWLVIPTARQDIIEANMCFAFERYTATVFHSMRIAERGLRDIAKRLGVKVTDKGTPIPIESATWAKVIDQIQSKIKIQRQKIKGKAQALRLQHYAEAADHCEYMKDLWRNEVSHAGKFYNEGEALGALNRVHDFMLFLVKGRKAKP
jgi:hypothetical protein